MKQNITINLNGQLYHIDQDAYDLLNTYLVSLREYFNRQEGGNEIVADIEARISELFNELNAAGVEAITIENVQQIMQQIGNPEDFASDGEEQSVNAKNEDKENKNSQQSASYSGSQSRNAKRYFLNKNDQVLFGVLSGASQYFGGSATLWRLGFVALVFIWFLTSFVFCKLFHIYTGNAFDNNIFGVFHFAIPFFPLNFLLNFIIHFLPVVAYLVTALVAPAVKTPADMLKMKGKDVNPKNLADEISQQADTYTQKSEENVSKATSSSGNYTYEYKKSANRSNSGDSFMDTLGTILNVIVHIIGFFFAMAFVMMMIVLIIFACLFMVGSHDYVDADFVTLMQNQAPQAWILFALLMIIGFIPVYCYVHSALCLFRKIKPMSVQQRIIWVIVFFISLIVAIIFSTLLIGEYGEIKEERGKREYAEWEESHTHDGVVIDDEDWAYFEQEGWKLIRNENCSDRITDTGEYYTGDNFERYLNAYSTIQNLIYQAEKTDSLLTPGTYCLTAAARCCRGSYGVYVYLTTENGDSISKHLAAVPDYGNTGQQIIEQFKKMPEEERPDSSFINSVTDANYGNGYGWSFVKIENIQINEGDIVRYGISSDKKFTGHKAHVEWLSATDFKLEKVD